MHQLTLPLVAVFALLAIACVKVDKMRLHHLTICVLLGIGIGVSFAGGEIWAVIVQLVRWGGQGLQQAG